MTLRSLRPSFFSSRSATRLAVALALGCAVSAPAHAFRLAHSRVVSAPNAPLQVLVGIADLTPDEQRSLMATLADPASWERAGVTPPVPLSSMTLRLEGGSNPTRRNLRISSPEAPKGPAVDMLLNIGTSEGQRQVQVSMMQTAGGFPGLTSQAQVGTGSRSARGGSAGAVAVRSGDTLYGIAQSNAVADATIYQMLVALWRANPNAFIQNNMNLVKAGATLVVPDAATVRAIDPAEARRIFIAQQEAYARYRASLAGAAARGTAASAGPATAGQVGGSQSTATPEPSPQDRVRLSSGEPGQGGAEAQAQSRGDAQTSAAKATEDAQQRVDQLERNVKDLNDALASARAAEQAKAGGAQAGSGRAPGANGQAGGIALPGFGGAAGSANGSSAAAGAGGRSAGASGANGARGGSAAGGGAALGSGLSGAGSAAGGGSGPAVALGSGLSSAGAQSATGTTGAAGQGTGATQNGSQGGGQAGANRAGAAKPGISGDAANLGGTAGTTGTPGSSASAAGGASAQAGASGAGGTGVSPAGSGSSASSAGAPGTGSPASSGSSASSAGTPGNPAQAGAATGTGSAAVATDGNSAADDTGGAAKAQDTLSGLPSWLSDNLLIILTAVLALIAFVIAWLLRRAAARREEDQDDLDDELYMSEIDQGAIDRRLDGINLDLDEPPVEGDRRRPGSVRT